MMKLHVSSSSTKMGGFITLPNLNLNMSFPSSSYCTSRDPKPSSALHNLIAAKYVISHRNAVCYAESSAAAASTVAAETKEEKDGESTTVAAKEDATAPAKPKPKPKPPAKAPAKALPEMMEEDVIPSLRSILEAQEDIKELELVYEDNKLEGSFLKKDIPYSFWALFPDGIAGPKGFSISSYGSTASSVEPFLVDEKKVTAKLLVFWVEKRLAAQGIIPVWRD